MEKAAGDRIKALRQRMTQAEFAKSFGVTQSMISAWEAGRDTPSAEIWIKLGEIAGYPDCYWFYERAGLDRQKLLTATEQTLKEQIKDADSPLLEGRIVLVPRVRRLPQGLEPAGLPVPMAPEAVPNLLSTYCLVLDGIEAVVDTADGGTEDLLPFLGQSVLVEFVPESARNYYRGWPTTRGVYAGVLYIGNQEYTLEGSLWQVMFLSQNTVVSLPIPVGSWLDTRVRLDPNPSPIVRSTPPQDIEKFLIPKSDTLRQKEEEEKTKRRLSSPEHAERWAAVRESNRLAIEEAARNVRLAPGCKILGRVIAWFPSPAAKAKE